jgi:hypothetical protein
MFWIEGANQQRREPSPREEDKTNWLQEKTRTSSPNISNLNTIKNNNFTTIIELKL